DFPAELVLKQPNVTSLSNFRVVRTTASPAQVGGLPGPGFFVQQTAIPPRSVIRFALTGHAVGAAVLEGRDLPGGRPPSRPDFHLLVSVKAKETRNFALCHVCDRINHDVGRRLDITRAFRSANAVLEEQANFNLVNIDGTADRTLRLGKPTGRA